MCSLWRIGTSAFSSRRDRHSDVKPGESYSTVCVPQRSIIFDEVLVEGFSLVQISIGTRAVTATLTDPEPPQHPARHLYRLDAPLTISVDESACFHLCNNTDKALKPKTTTLVRDVAATVITETA